MTEAPKEEQALARVLGHTLWRQEFIKANPEMSKEDQKAKFASGWAEVRRDYMRIGFQVLRQLRKQGYVIHKSDDPVSPDAEPVADSLEEEA